MVLRVARNRRAEAEDGKMAEYAVKIRASNGKTWSFLSGTGKSSRLRVFAIRYPSKERADYIAASVLEANPDRQVKVVKLTA
mgnify:CR=1 FL=1